MDLLDKFNAGLPERLHEDECWEWQLKKLHNRGYGKFYHNGELKLAHRVSYEVHYAEPLGELHCLHKCDNPSCVNPAHLFAGTHKQNMEDKVAKGRSGGGGPRGSRNGASKLTEEQVDEMRRLRQEGFKYSQLMEKFNITSTATIHNIIHNKIWEK